ncbi:CHAD domain-containing protein [Salinicoccus sp. HZC-1]|uniref:CHAD domain-containing protein n=1 Tax=Salinicoccus sp. HZC-1 TaxID=3385497 RepID=UPI00398AF3E0
MEEILKVLSKRTDKLKKAYTDYQNNPYQPETAHKVRTHSRKLRSLLNFLKKTFDEDEYDRLNDELKNLARIYGRLREVDVLIELCTEIALDEPGLSDDYKALFAFLHKERLKEMRRTFNKTKVRSAESALAAVEAGVGNISLKEKPDWGRYIKKRLVKKNRRLTEAYHNADMDDHEAVHEIRKKAKKLRFSAKYLGKFSSGKHKKMTRNAQRIQDEFGVLTDAHVNRQMLETYAERVDDEALKKLFYKIDEAQQKMLNNSQGGA